MTPKPPRRPACRRSLLFLLLGLAGTVGAAPGGDPRQFALCHGGPLLDWIEPVAADPRRELAPVDVDADTIDVSGKDLYVLEGDARLRRADQRLHADRLEYTHSRASYRASGDVRYQDAGVAVGATSVEGEIDVDRTRLADVRYQLIALRGNGEAASADLRGATGDFTRVSYSTCDPQQQSWVLRAEQMHIDREEGVGTMRNATLRIGDVPLLWLPYASFPIDDRRRSGFLYPTLGNGGDSGIDIRVPYYLNLAPNFDATLSARVLGHRGVMLGAEFRYLFDDHLGQIDGDWLPDDDRTGRDRGLGRLRHVSRLSERWQFDADVSSVSDDRYFEDFGDSLSVSSTSLLGSHVGLRGRGENWKASVAAERWELTDPLISDIAEPYRRLPRALYHWDRPFGDWLELRFDAEAIAFEHDLRPDATRFDLRPAIALPFERAWGYVRPELAWRQTDYSLSRDFGQLGLVDRDPDRGTPIGSLDAALVFERDTTLFGEAMRQTLQPRLYYLNVPFEAQDDLPILDTQELTFSWNQLFRPNRFSGADRQMDANQLAIAVTTRLFENASGRERLSASLGQIRYFEAQRVQLPGLPPADVSGSAYVGDLEVAVSDRLGIGVTQQWDPNLDATTVSGVRGVWRGQSGALLNLAYRYRRAVLEQTDASFVIPLSPSWRMVGRWNYSLRDDTTLEGLAGFEWDSCCIAARVLARHYLRNREGEKNNAIYVELELKGLGSFGRDSGEFLQRAILGYSR